MNGYISIDPSDTDSVGANIIFTPPTPQILEIVEDSELSVMSNVVEEHQVDSDGMGDVVVLWEYDDVYVVSEPEGKNG